MQLLPKMGFGHLWLQFLLAEPLFSLHSSGANRGIVRVLCPPCHPSTPLLLPGIMSCRTLWAKETVSNTARASESWSSTPLPSLLLQKQMTRAKDLPSKAFEIPCRCMPSQPMRSGSVLSATCSGRRPCPLGGLPVASRPLHLEAAGVSIRWHREAQVLG